MTYARRDPDQRLLRRTRIVLAVNLTAAISWVVLLVGGIAYVVTTQQQEGVADRYLGLAMHKGTVPGIQYSCLWLFIVRNGEVEGADQAPPGLPLRGSILAVATSGLPMEESFSRNDTVYRVRTERHGNVVRQAVFDDAYLRENHWHLFGALVIAGLVGMAGAAAAGTRLSRRAIAPLEEALDRQRRFVADASHELRAPLTRLHTRTQLLLRGAPTLPQPVVAELRQLARGSRELSEVVDDLLASARLRSGRPEFERVDLSALAADLIAAEAGRLGEHELVAHLAVPESGLVVAGIEASLRRMLSALVDNAIGHGRPGGKIAIGITAVDGGRTVELVVADDGAGLDPARRHTIFTRFVRGNTGRGQRHGIGLALVREVVEDHRGTITAEGEPDNGARFTVRLPAARR
ncbi:sensor histidine kinase KdpD [Actinoplanes sp. ATCC 53533]|uniref:sensor histidine kinase n=1 Tax=Actinoplanes sp. ATCC 53533 TaxID=1288362 RepID=UPI0013152904|nr:HAMP domain-containing sensor histidine kinase [Actinoplanes sp. ATCC 53533]